MTEDDNIVSFPAKGTHANPNVELLTKPDAYALVQLVDGNVITSYETDNVAELIGMIDLLRHDLIEDYKGGNREPA